MTQDGVGATILASSVQLTDFCEILNIANAGDHVIYSSAIYGGIYNLITNIMKSKENGYWKVI